jgi:hypothetical protein
VFLEHFDFALEMRTRQLMGHSWFNSKMDAWKIIREFAAAAKGPGSAGVRR